MAERRRTFYPPPLDHYVKLRNPCDQPEPTVDAVGNLTVPEWGVDAHAGRTDRTPYTVIEDGVPVHVGITVWTIRKRPGVAADVQVVWNPTRVPGNERIYDSQGEPVERGGPAEGRRERYLQIHTKIRR